MARSRSRLPDWLFSGTGKRLVLEALLLHPQPRGGWSRSAITRAARQHPKARVDKYLAPLVQAGMLERHGAHYRINERHGLTKPLRKVLQALRQLPDEEIRRS